MGDEAEDTPARPRRRIRRVTVLSSASDSESDDGVVATRTRRKRMRVVSDEDSDSSGSSVVRAGTRRTRALPQLHDSDGVSDASPRATRVRRASVPPAAARHGASPRAAVHAASGFASDSSEGNSEKCSICLLRFTDQEVGTPETCEHIFCLDCITEWSRNVNTCPVDRITFNSIVVRACAGGRVLRSEPVVVIERRPSVDVLVIEDAETVCEICGRTDDEDTMLLCDGCDLGYHMLCLTPPLRQVPADQWLCPNCYDLLDMNLSEVDDLEIGDIDEYMHVVPLPMLLQQARGASALARSQPSVDEPSTSSGRRATPPGLLPSTSGRATRHTPRAVPRRRAAATHAAARRKTRRRTRTVLIEYEEAEKGKRPILKKIKRRVKKRKMRKRQPRTAARRTLVRQSVRAKLATMKLDERQEQMLSNASSGAQELSVRRQRAGIPSLSILGNPNQLEYFSEEEEHDVSQGGSVGVAMRPASYMRDTLRQVRRKNITISSPPHASAAPDILSSILESQTLLHSKKSLVSISVDGNVNIKLENRDRKSTKKTSEVSDDSRINVLKGEDAAKKVPSYPGQSRGGGWGGGYRGNYHREQGTTGFGRGSYNEGNYGGNYQSRQGNSYQNSNARREDNDAYTNYSRRPHQYSQNDDTAFDRNRRHSDVGRGPNHNQRHSDHGRYSTATAPAWQPYAAASAPRQEPPAPHHRHSFGGFDNPLDMRTGHISQHMSGAKLSDGFAPNDAQRRDRSQPYRPLPEPPVFNYDKTPDIEKSEDEKSDSSLVIDTDKYDPTEPTRDDDSGDEDETPSAPSSAADPALAAKPALCAPTAPPAPPAPVAPPVAVVEPMLQEPAPSPIDVRSALASIDTSGLSVPPGVLDSAVRQVLKEHRDLLAPPARPVHRPPPTSDDDSDGDCPNFSIYSATSVHIANNTGVLVPELASQLPQDNLEDLVQEDDTPEPEEQDSEPEAEPEPEPEPEPGPTFELKPFARDAQAPSSKQTDPSAQSSKHSVTDSKIKKRSEEEYNEKVSKRCPITTNTRNPIKIKLNTPSLIKRHVSLYDDDDVLLGEDTAPSSNESQPSTEPTGTPPQASPSEKQDTSKLTHIDQDETIADTLENSKDSNKEEELPEKDRSPITEHDGNMTPEPRESHTPCERSVESHAPARGSDQVDDKSSDLDIDIKEKLVEPLENEFKPDNETNSDEDASDSGAPERSSSRSPVKNSAERNDDALEKMTESISETEDERSYTPCLDENKSKDTSLETDKDKGIEGLDTEMISEEEGNEMFSEEERARSEPARASPPPRAASDATPAPDDEQSDVKKDTKPDTDVKKKKKKESKKEIKDRSKSKRKAEVAFRKLSKSGKERNYRERDKDGAGARRDSTDSADREKRKRKRKEKRKDLERYDVRTVVSEKRRKRKDPFGRDVSPRVRSSRSPSLSRSPPPRRSTSRVRRSISRVRRSVSRVRRSISRARLSPPRRPSSRLRRTGSPSPARRRRTATPRVSPSPPSPRAASPRRRRRSTDRAKRAEPRRRRSADRARKRRRSASASKSPRPKSTKRKKRARSERPVSRRRSPRRKSPRRRRARRRSASRVPEASPARAAPPAAPSEPGAAWSPGSVDSRLASPRTPPPAPPADEAPARRRRDPDRARHRRARDAGGASKEVFTSGDNILVSVSFKEQERAGDDERRERRRERRRRRRRPAAPEPEAGAPRPVAIIDLERSPFRELTPSPRNVIVLSDSEPGERESGPVPEPAASEPVGPKTPPEPAAPEVVPEPAQDESRGPNTPPEPPDSPDAYDPYEPTRSASASPSPVLPASPPRTTITLETAQKTNMSADEVLDRRPLSPIEKVMALLQSTREVSPEPPPDPPAAAEAAPPAAAAPAPSACAAAPPAAAPAPPGPPVRIVLPEPTRPAPPKLFLAKPSPIKSDPIKPMQAAKLPRPAPQDSPYSPGSSDFGELFEPPPGAAADRPRRHGRPAAKVPVKLHRNKGKLQVGVKIDEDNLKILDDLPSSAVEMQVKSKFLKKLNRQERVVEEVKLVLKPHYNKKHITKEEYKDILRRAVPKICHNKSGEINPTKIQALIEAYVKKIRKKHKLGLV